MSRNTEATDDVKTWTGGPLNYKEGFFTQLATDELAKGINEEVVRAISAKRNEPEWMLEFRLNAERRVWIQVVKGNVTINGVKASTSDGLAIWDEQAISIHADSDSEILLFDLPPV